MIVLNQLSKIYQIGNSKFTALKDIDLTIHRGEIFGVLGKSGAGKSTLLRCVNSLEKPSSGQVIVDDVDLNLLSPQQLRQQRHKISMIFQHFNLLESRSVFANVALPLEILGQSIEQIQKKVSTLLELVGLSEKRDYFPSKLSGGQKQRVGIARALASDPYVLLCDEATSALDPESTQSILSLLKKINRELGITILLITHELDVVKQICDRVGVIDQGQLIELGATVTLFSTPRHPITKQLIEKSYYFNLPDQVDKNACLLKLTFMGADSEEPLISSLVKKFDVTVNIKQALIEKIQDTTIGFTICQIVGERTAIENSLQYIKSTSVKAEVLHAVT